VVTWLLVIGVVGRCLTLELLALVFLEEALKQRNGGAEVVVKLHQQVDVVDVLVAVEAVGEVVAGVDGGPHFAAAGTAEEIGVRKERLPNDSYTLRLTASNGGGNKQVDIPVEVAGHLKLGDFTTSFTDLTIPVAGIPIGVTGDCTEVSEFFLRRVFVRIRSDHEGGLHR
jgi:hypothetical protein